VLYLWARAVLAAAGVRTQARGVENLPAGHFVLCVNHQSHFDSLLLFAHIRRHMRFIAKQQLRKIPVFGYALARAGNVFVDRTGSDSDKSKLKDSVRAVQERVSIVFFAEGTRSKDGKLAPFKKGAAVLRYELGQALPVRDADFPTTTRLINITGALILGLLLGWFGRHRPADTTWRPLIGVGVLGDGVDECAPHAVLGVRHADEAGDGEADGLEKLPDLPLPAFVDLDREDRMTVPPPQDLDPGGRRLAPFEKNPMTDLVKVVFPGLAFDPDVVDLSYAVTGMGQPEGHVSVVRQEKSTLRIDVEAPDGIDPDRKMGQEVHDRRPSERVLDADDPAGRLVEEDKDGPVLFALDEMTAGDDLVARSVDLLAQLLDDLAVDADPALGDDAVCLAPRTDPGVGQELVQAHRCHCRTIINQNFGDSYI
jgi:1-acyl-sn-glycerol-3-phosphate acyltransferase